MKHWLNARRSRCRSAGACVPAIIMCWANTAAHKRCHNFGQSARILRCRAVRGSESVGVIISCSPVCKRENWLDSSDSSVCPYNFVRFVRSVPFVRSEYPTYTYYIMYFIYFYTCETLPIFRCWLFSLPRLETVRAQRANLACYTEKGKQRQFFFSSSFSLSPTSRPRNFVFGVQEWLGKCEARSKEKNHNFCIYVIQGHVSCSIPNPTITYYNICDMCEMRWDKHECQTSLAGPWPDSGLTSIYNGIDFGAVREVAKEKYCSALARVEGSYFFVNGRGVTILKRKSCVKLNLERCSILGFSNDILDTFVLNYQSSFVFFFVLQSFVWGMMFSYW